MAPDRPDLRPRPARLLITVAAAAVLTASVPDYLATGAPLGEDNSSHFAEVLYVAELLSGGETDFWFDQTNLGYPLFLAYQPAPSLSLGALVAITSPIVPPLLLFKLSIVLSWALLPVTWYLGGRWLGLRRIEATLFGLFVLAVNDFRSFGLGLTAGLANGLYTQTWGALLLPMALGATWRHLFGGRSGGPAVVLLSLTLLCHAFLGLYAALASGVMLIASTGEFWIRARRLAGDWALVLAATAFWTLPFVAGLDYQGGLPWKSESENGYPLADLALWTFTGSVFDHGRLPWLTFLVVSGLVLAILRRREVLPRFGLLLFVATFALLMGRTNWGAPYSWIPFHGELEVVRYLSGLHFAGLLLAALAAARGFDLLPRALESLSGPGWLTPERTRATILLLLTGGFVIGLHLYTRSSLQTFDAESPDFRGVAERLADGSNSRFLCHKRLDTATHMHFNLLPALAGRPHLQSFARGYHDTLSLYYLQFFDFSASAFRLYNVGAVVARGERPDFLPESFRETWSGEELMLLESDEAPGYFAFVRTPASLVGDLRRVRPLLRRASVALYELGTLPRLTSNGVVSGPEVRLGDGRELFVRESREEELRKASFQDALAILAGPHPGAPIESTVLEEKVGFNRYRAVVMSRGEPERLLLKASYHPQWRATIDGVPAEIDHVAPNFMAILVPEGRHEVVFQFRNAGYQKLLFLGSAAGLLLWIGGRLVRRVRSEPEEA